MFTIEHRILDHLGYGRREVPVVILLDQGDNYCNVEAARRTLMSEENRSRMPWLRRAQKTILRCKGCVIVLTVDRSKVTEEEISEALDLCLDASKVAVA